MSHIKRRDSIQVMVGDVPVGGGAPIVVQSMTNTDTSDVDATAEQIKYLHRESPLTHQPNFWLNGID